MAKITVVNSKGERVEIEDVESVLVPEGYGNSTRIRFNNDNSFTVRADFGVNIELEASNTFTIRRTPFTAKERGDVTVETGVTDTDESIAAISV